MKNYTEVIMRETGLQQVTKDDDERIDRSKYSQMVTKLNTVLTRRLNAISLTTFCLEKRVFLSLGKNWIYIYILSTLIFHLLSLICM